MDSFEVNKILGAILGTLESIFGWILSAIAFVIEFILSIPIIGRLIGWVLAAVETVVWFVVGIADTIAGILCGARRGDGCRGPPADEESDSGGNAQSGDAPQVGDRPGEGQRGE